MLPIVLIQLSLELEIIVPLWYLVSTKAIFQNRSVRKGRPNLLVCC